MARRSLREMRNLLAATDAGDHNLGIGGGGVHRRRETKAGDGTADIIVLLFKAERSGHAAASRVDLRDLITRGHPQRPQGRAGANMSLLVAMAVQQELLLVGTEREIEAAGILKNAQKLFE